MTEFDKNFLDPDYGLHGAYKDPKQKTISGPDSPGLANDFDVIKMAVEGSLDYLTPKRLDDGITGPRSAIILKVEEVSLENVRDPIIQAAKSASGLTPSELGKKTKILLVYAVTSGGRCASLLPPIDANDLDRLRDFPRFYTFSDTDDTPTWVGQPCMVEITDKELSMFGIFHKIVNPAPDSQAASSPYATSASDTQGAYNSQGNISMMPSRLKSANPGTEPTPLSSDQKTGVPQADESMSQFYNFNKGRIKDWQPKAWSRLHLIWGTLGWPGYGRAGEMIKSGLQQAYFRPVHGWKSPINNKVPGNAYGKSRKVLLPGFVFTEEGIRKFYNFFVNKGMEKDMPYDLNTYLQNWVGKKWVGLGYEAHWSAAFIQWCFRDVPEFKIHSKKGAAAKYGGLGSHRPYWMMARNNSKILSSAKGTQKDPLAVDWVYFKVGAINYEMKVGDIAMVHQSPKHHGDIVTPLGRIGGNVGNTCRIQRGTVRAIVTRSTEAKKKLLMA